MYIVPNSLDIMDYCYVYKETEAKYNVHVSRLGNVTGFDKNNSFSKLGGAIAKNVNWGNHLTVGIERSFSTRRILLTSHKTVYSPDPDDPNEYQGENLYCNIFLTDTPPNETTECVFQGTSDGTLMKYAQVAKDETAIEVVKVFHDKIVHRQRGGKLHTIEFAYHNGKRYKVHTGNRGGRFIVVTNRHIYLNSLKGGVGDGSIWEDDRTKAFTETFVDFIGSMAINQVGSNRDDLVEAIIVDDGSDHFMMRYVFGFENLTLSNVFAVSKSVALQAFEAYLTPTEQQTPDMATNLQAFQAIFQPVYVKVQ